MLKGGFGLDESPRLLYEMRKEELLSDGWTQNKLDLAVFMWFRHGYQGAGNTTGYEDPDTILLVYVDDLRLYGSEFFLRGWIRKPKRRVEKIKGWNYDNHKYVGANYEHKADGSAKRSSQS